MIKKYSIHLVVLLACLAPVIGLSGQIGEPAPPLSVKEWLQGKPVEIKAGTNIYVVEIWVSWSAGCRAAITNLNEVQKRFRDKGVVVAAISDEPIDKLKTFVEQNGTNIHYAVAADDLRQTSRNYMIPVHQQVVPYAFVVGTKGNLLWHGSPFRGLDQALDQIIAGQYDIEQAKKADVDRHQLEQYLVLAQRSDRRAAMAGRALLGAWTNDQAQLCDLAFQIATHPHIPKRDVALAGQALDQAEKLGSTNALRVTLTRDILLFETGKTNEAMTRVRQTLASAQTQKDKDEAQACLRTMEARLKERAAARAKAATNHTHTASATNASPSAITNHSQTVPSGKAEKAEKSNP